MTDRPTNDDTQGELPEGPPGPEQDCPFCRPELLAGAVAVSELVILIAGTPLMFWIEQTLEGRGVGLRPPEDEP